MGPRGNFPRGFRRTLSSAGLGVEVGVDLGADLDHIGCRSGANRVPKGSPGETDTERASPRDRNRFRTIDHTIGIGSTHIGTHISTHIATSISDGPASDKSYQHGATRPPLEPASYKKVGCYKDQKPPSRAMCPGTTECTLQVNADGAEKCARYCGGMMNVPGSTIYSWNAINATNAPHVYFALQGGIWCYCSNDLAKTKEWGEVYTCAQCTPGIADRPQSASDQANGLYCGADWTNSVYETPYPANHQNCPGGETFRRIVQWRDCNPDDDHDDDIAPVEGGSIFDAPPLPAPLPAPPLPAPQQPIPPPSTPTVQVVEKVDGTTKEKDCLSDISDMC
eukprot:g20547.t1